MASPDPRYPDHIQSPQTHDPLAAQDLSPLLPQAAVRPCSQPHISSLQVRAWTIANMSYEVPGGESYRADALDLYRQDMHERITCLFECLDAQNGAIDAQLRAQRVEVALGRAVGSPQTAPSPGATLG